VRPMIALMGRSTRSLGISFACLLVCLTVTDVSAQPSLRSSDEISAEFGRAMILFNSGDVVAAERSLSNVIEGISALRNVLTSPQRDWLLQSLSLRSQLRFDLDDAAAASTDLIWLGHLDVDFSFNRLAVSPKFIKLVDDTRRVQAGRVRLRLKAPTKVSLDGRRIDGTTVFAATPGNHEMIVEAFGQRETLTIDVPRGRTGDMIWEPTPTEVQDSQPPIRVRTGGRRSVPTFLVHPPRILFARLDGAMDAYGEAFTGVSFFPLYGRYGTLDSSYAFERPELAGGRQVGGTIRVYKHLALGVTRTRTQATFSSSVDAQIPHPQSNLSPRSVETLYGPLERTQELVHTEVTATGGGDNWEFALFAGPSFMTINQELISGITVREQSGSASITSGQSRVVHMDRVVGMNIGLDGTWYFLRYAGLGGGIRYSRGVSTLNFELGETKLILGGTQLSVGARFRF